MSILRVNVPMFEGMFTELNKLVGFNSLLQSCLLVIMAQSNVKEFVVTADLITQISEKYDLDLNLDEKNGVYTVTLKEIPQEEVIAQEASFKVIQGGNGNDKNGYKGSNKK